MAGRNEHESGYAQPLLEGLGTPETVETELDNCLLLSRPIYTDTGKFGITVPTGTNGSICGKG